MPRLAELLLFWWNKAYDKQASVAQLDMTGDQEVAGSTPLDRKQSFV